MFRREIVGRACLALVLCAGGFVAGFLLMNGPEGPPAAMTSQAVAVATATASAPATGPLLRIVKAVYGDLPDGPSTDVTQQVARAAAEAQARFEGAGTLEFKIAATNELFGDPAEGIFKKLRVDYVLDGREVSRTVEENTTLQVKVGRQRLIIQRAVYGDLPEGPSADVTRKVAGAADLDRLSIAAVNDLFDDPAVGIPKKLRVDYTFDGKERDKTVTEGETLTISPSGE